MVSKQNEREILDLIYSESGYAEIVDSERPDFRVKHKGANSYFGVEITEFYYSESNARLRKIPSYFNEIIDLHRYRHKHDKTILKADEVTLMTAEGEFKAKTRGIIQRLPQPSEYANMVANIIKIKSTKVDEYNYALTHTNLIVLDAERGLTSVPIGDFYNYFFTNEIREVLYSTSFQEVFLVTVLDKNRHVYIPLKMLLLFADFHMFATIVSEYPWPTSDDPEDESSEDALWTSIFMNWFAKYMRSKSERIYLKEDVGQVEVFFGNSSMAFEAGHKILIDHNDYLQPIGLQTIAENELTTFFQSTEFIEKEKEILAGVKFYAEVALNVKVVGKQG